MVKSVQVVLMLEHVLHNAYDVEMVQDVDRGCFFFVVFFSPPSGCLSFIVDKQLIRVWNACVPNRTPEAMHWHSKDHPRLKS